MLIPGRGNQMDKYIVALTGASGVQYGIELIRQLSMRGTEIHLVASDPACIVLQEELGWEFSSSRQETFERYLPYDNLIIYDNKDIAARIASGSYITDGMVIIPCTMATLSAISHGNARNLVERAADVMLKERRPLWIVPRETPVSTIHLRNMLTLAELGVSIIPAMPAFYNHPRSIDDMVLFMVGKVLDVMHIEHDLYTRYDK